MKTPWLIALTLLAAAPFALPVASAHDCTRLPVVDDNFYCHPAGWPECMVEEYGPVDWASGCGIVSFVDHYLPNVIIPEEARPTYDFALCTTNYALETPPGDLNPLNTGCPLPPVPPLA